MSLQVWLPLNGNLNNQGLSDVNITNNGATVNNNGKIGKCYSFNGSSSFLSIPAVLNATNQNFSICAWMKFNSTSGTYTLYTSRTAVGEGLAIFRVSGNKIRFDDGGLQTTFDYECNTTWTHICVTRDIQSKKLYINGELKQTVLSVGQMTNLYNGNGSIGASTTSGSGAGNYLNGNINDFRIYDHCLSKKEVKEIAKGLCLHYQLNSSSENLLGNSNLIINTPLIYTYAAKHGYSIDTNFKNNLKDILLYAYQNNLGFTLSYDINVPRCWPNSANSYNRCGVYWGFSVKDNTTGTTYNWYGNHSGPNTATSKHNLAIGTNSLNAMTASATSTNPDTRFIGHYSCTVYPQNQTNATMKGFYTNPNNYTLGTPYLNAEITGYSVDEASITNIKLELGNDETAWCPNIDDKEYLVFKSGGNVEYDCSGFGNDGIKTGNLIIKNLSARYNACNNFKNLDKIVFPDIPLDSFKEGTISFWLKVNSYTHWTHYLHFSNSFNWTGKEYDAVIIANTSQTNSTSITLDCCSYTSTFAAPIETWHHYVITWDKDYKIKKYIDGILKNTHDDSTNKRLDTYMTKRNNRGLGNVYNNATSYDGDFDMSDFRIYSTALSADEIVELYEVGASIAKGDTLWGYELVEG